MADAIQLKAGNYKGEDILFVEASTAGGNRLIKFQYPGSDNQSIEYQGKARRSFTLTIWIPLDNYYERRERLLRVLEDGTKGVFVHPTFGAIENVINGRYTLTERVSELGRASVNVTFEIDDGEGIPVQSGALAAQVRAESDALNAVATADLADTFEVTLSNTGNFTDALDTLNNVADSFGSAFDLANAVADVAAEFSQSLKDFAEDAADLIEAPTDLADRVDDIFTSLDSYFDSGSAADAVAVFSDLFGYGSDDPTIEETTVGLTERKLNRDAMRVAMQAQALSHAWVNYCLISYDTTEQLDAAQAALETQYQNLRLEPALNNETLEQLDRLRVQGQKTLDTVRVNTRQVVTIDIDEREPLTVLVYRYYGSTELVDVIAELNNVEQHAFVTGELRMLSA